LPDAYRGSNLFTVSRGSAIVPGEAARAAIE
jgi:hypothetical protein